MVLKAYFFGTLIFLVSCTSVGENGIPTQPLDLTLTGERLYEMNCSSCHGPKGNLGNSGSFDLTKTKMTAQEIEQIIIEGRKAMPPFMELVANPQYIDSLVNHVEKLRK
jgi:mono/diheme cytochrome c family protein